MLSQARNFLPRNSFARGVSVLVGGTLGSQVLMMLASPLLTRLYTPEDFGLLAVYAALLALFSVVASLRYELAIPLPETHVEAANIAILSLLVVVLMSVISGLIVLLAGQRVSEVLNTPELAAYFWLLPIGVLLSGTYKVFNYWAIRLKKFGDISRTRITQSVSLLIIQIAGFKLGGGALLVGQAIGQGAGSFRLAKSAIESKDFHSWSWIGVLESAKLYQNFPKFSVWTGLFNSAGSQLPPILLASFFTAGAAGLFALAHRVLAMPLSVLGEAVGHVFFSGAADAYRENRLSLLVKNIHRKLTIISLPLTLFLIFYAPELFLFFFGESWEMSGEIARWMAPWLFFQFVSSPLSPVFAVLHKEHETAFFQGAFFIVRLACVVYGGLFLNLLQTVMIFSVLSAFLYGIYLAIIFKHSGLGALGFFSTTLKNFLALLPIFLANLMFQYIFLIDFGILFWVVVTFIYIAAFYLKNFNLLFRASQ